MSADNRTTYNFDEHTDAIGEGMFATVYRGTNTSTDTIAADVAREAKFPLSVGYDPTPTYKWASKLVCCSVHFLIFWCK